MICVLVCMLIAIALVGSTLKHSLQARREVRTQYQMLQTELLLDAGILRASQGMMESPDYQGETWRPAEAVSRFSDALVAITVVDDDVTVSASLGVAAEDAKQFTASRTKRSHTFTFENSKSTPESSNAE
ncbi:MAG: hypothetical protein AB8B91_13755 [Rubripirellula sp.]